MLAITHKTHFDVHLPHLGISHPMQFSKVINDNDELTKAIGDDTGIHDDQWTLEELADGKKLDEFWSEVETDIHKDPTWFDFNDDQD